MEYKIKYSSIAEESLINIFDDSEKIILINNIFFIKRDIKNVLNN